MLNDDVQQSAAAQQLVEQRFWLSHTVLLELGWVLFKALKLPRKVTADMLQQLIDLETVELENYDGLDWAIGQFRRGADWADMAHIAACPRDVSHFVSFDRKFAQKAGAKSPLKVEVLRP